MSDKGRIDFLKKDYEQKQKIPFLDSLPLSVFKLTEMFDVVDGKLEKEG